MVASEEMEETHSGWEEGGQILTVGGDILDKNCGTANIRRITGAGK